MGIVIFDIEKNRENFDLYQILYRRLIKFGADFFNYTTKYEDIFLQDYIKIFIKFALTSDIY